MSHRFVFSFFIFIDDRVRYLFPLKRDGNSKFIKFWANVLKFEISIEKCYCDFEYYEHKNSNHYNDRVFWNEIWFLWFFYIGRRYLNFWIIVDLKRNTTSTIKVFDMEKFRRKYSHCFAFKICFIQSSKNY